MMREPAATAQTRQFRVAANLLTKNVFFSSSYDCANSRMQANRVFAQSPHINFADHEVVSGQ